MDLTLVDGWPYCNSVVALPLGLCERRCNHGCIDEDQNVSKGSTGLKLQIASLRLVVNWGCHIDSIIKTSVETAIENVTQVRNDRTFYRGEQY